jgi:hypothetical protein
MSLGVAPTVSWRNMTFLTDEQRGRMLANGAARARGEAIDPMPVVKLYTLDAGAVWLSTDLDADGDRAYGLCDADHISSTDFSYLASGKGIIADRIGAMAGYQSKLPGHLVAQHVRRVRP